MLHLLETLKLRNELLSYFGWACLLAAGGCLLLAQLTQTQVLGVNAWYKPFKFFLSTAIFVWSMAWYLFYLGPLPAVRVYSWVAVATFGFELVYIAGQAARGQQSHFNVSSPVYAAMFSAMAGAIVLMTLWTGYMGLLFFQQSFPNLPPAYVWGIRLGIVLFVVFALEGGLMGSRLAHTVGGPADGPGLPVLNWSRKYGDLRIAHFVGMHALQVLPLLAYYVLPSVRLTLAVGLLYGLVAVFVLVQALQGRPLVAQPSQGRTADG